MSEKDPNWKFWGEYILQTGFSYICLFSAIRSGNWELHLSSLKLMAPVFAAFDRTTYRKLIPQHLADCLLMPKEITNCLQRGGFSVSITGHKWHLVAIDEAHEMLVNKDCKEAIVRPSKEFADRIALSFLFVLVL